MSNPTAKHYENGIDTFFTYDVAHRLTGVEHRNGANLLASFAYTLDRVGNRKSKSLTGLATVPTVETYGYEAVDQLIQAKYGTTRTVGYAYDAAGNRQSVSNNGTTQGCSANALNQYTVAAGSTPTYDANGNLASATGATYTYDAQNRLVSATVNGTTTTLSYDARNRVVRRTTGGADLFFTYAGWNLLEERNAAGAIQQAYVHGAQIDELLVKITPTGAVYYHADALGSVIALTNETGQLAESYTYDAFGAATVWSATGATLAQTALGNRFLFTGREWIAASGIYDFRNRVYSPVLGRFLQTDPIRFSAGDVNIYRYVGNDTIGRVDPTGLWTGQIGISVNVQVGPVSLHGSAGIAFDGHGNVKPYTTAGGGAGFGANGQLGLTGAWSNGDCIKDLQGPFQTNSIGGGDGVDGSFDTFAGTGSHDQPVVGGGISVGAGAGGGAWSGITGTRLW